MNFNTAFAKSLIHIEGFFFSEVVVCLDRNGVLGCFNKDLTIAEVAREMNFDESVLSGICGFLEIEGVISIADGRVHLTPYGNQVLEQIGWFNLLVGGYGPTMNGLEDILRKGKNLAERNEIDIAIGSGRIDQYDVIPTAIRVIEKWSVPTDHVVDLGCGTASCLADLCEARRSLACVGVAGRSEVATAARALVSRRGLSDRITILDVDATEYRCDFVPDVFLIAFVLQEIAYQQGIEGLVSFLERLRRNNPTAWLLVFEVPNISWSNEELATDAGRYYRCYLLVHHLTRQQLLTVEQWRDVFMRSGYRLISTETIEEPHDHTGLEVCFVMRPNE